MGASIATSTGDFRPERPSLSRQEQLILSLAGQGLADKEIAKKIGISMGTVRTYWQRMRDKTNARSRSEILALCLHTAHSQTVDELQRMKARFSALIEASSVGLALLDEYGEIVEVNPAFVNMVGLTAAELVGTLLRDVSELRDLTDCSHLAVYQGGGSILQMSRQTVQIEGRAFEVLTLFQVIRMPGLALPVQVF